MNWAKLFPILFDNIQIDFTSFGKFLKLLASLLYFELFRSI